jgi:uncharacterized membrane protein (UPF0127 family)
MRNLRIVTILDRTSGALVGTRIRVADTALSRLIGLLGTTELQPGSGLLLVPSSGIHTLGMRFPLDVLALDRHMRACRAWENLQPGRVTLPSWGTHSVLELPAGTVSRSGIAVGDQLIICTSPAEWERCEDMAVENQTSKSLTQG